MMASTEISVKYHGLKTEQGKSESLLLPPSCTILIIGKNPCTDFHFAASWTQYPVGTKILFNFFLKVLSIHLLKVVDPICSLKYHGLKTGQGKSESLLLPPSCTFVIIGKNPCTDFHFAATWTRYPMDYQNIKTIIFKGPEYTFVKGSGSHLQSQNVRLDKNDGM